jgi:RNA polymerase sigma factor (sigma-70 family)
MSSVVELPDPDEALLESVAPARARLRAVPALDELPLDFDDVVRRLTPRLQRYATRRLGDRHEAEELVQEALLRAYNHRDSLHTEDDVAAWSTCVTGRLVIDRLRVRGRSTSMAEVPEGARVGRDTADVVVARDEARLALDALDAMPPRQAAVLWAREVEGLAYDEIGARFSMTEPAVRSVLSRARKALRKEFATRGGTLPAGGLVALAPWLDGLTWLDRLRSAMTRTATPAALGVASLGLIGGAVLGPWGADVDPATPPRVTAASAMPTHEVALARASVPPSPRPAVVAASAVHTHPPSPAPPARPAPAILARTGVTDSCVEAEASETSIEVPLVGAVGGPATAGGTDCAPQQNSVLHVGPALPDNPTGVKRVGIEGRSIDCSAIPSTAITQCTSDGETR